MIHMNKNDARHFFVRARGAAAEQDDDCGCEFYAVDNTGFNAIDHTVVNFHPVDDGFIDGSDFEKHFKYFDFGKKPTHFMQIHAWKNLGKPVSLVASGGHQVSFEGRHVYPYNL